MTEQDDEMWETLPLKQRGFILPSPSMIMAGAIVMLSISNVIFFKLWRNAIDEFATYRAAVVAAQKQAEADADKARLVSAGITADVSNAWAAALDHARRHPVVRVLPARCDLPQASAVPTAGFNADGTPAQSGSGGEILVSLEQCQARLDAAAEDAGKVILLQRFVREQHEASK